MVVANLRASDENLCAYEQGLKVGDDLLDYVADLENLLLTLSPSPGFRVTGSIVMGK